MGLSCQKHPQNEVLDLFSFVYFNFIFGFKIVKIDVLTLYMLYMTLNHQTNNINRLLG